MPSPSLRMRIAVVILVAASGAMETLSLAALGHVFAGVMTGNLALLGMSVGHGGGALGRAAALALAGFGLGAGVGAWVTRGRRPVSETPREADPRRAQHPRQSDTRPTPHPPDVDGWPPRVRICLIAETALLAAIAIWWLVVDGAPATPTRDVLQVAAALAMGAQSAAMVAAGRLAAPTTYLTGALATYIVNGLDVSASTDAWVPVRLAALVAGAAGAALIRQSAPGWTAVLPCALAATAVALGSSRERHPLKQTAIVP